MVALAVGHPAVGRQLDLVGQQLLGLRNVVELEVVKRRALPLVGEEDAVLPPPDRSIDMEEVVRMEES